MSTWLLPQWTRRRPEQGPGKVWGFSWSAMLALASGPRFDQWTTWKNALPLASAITPIRPAYGGDVDEASVFSKMRDGPTSGRSVHPAVRGRRSKSTHRDASTDAQNGPASRAAGPPS